VLALQTSERLKELHPDFPAVDAMIADFLALLGRGRQALEAFDLALAKDPDNVHLQSDRLFVLNNFGLADRQQIFDEHAHWGSRHEAALRTYWRPHPQLRDSDRQLRVGYLSPDLRHHAVAFFIEGVLRSHDRSQFEIHAIDVSPYELDHVSLRLQALCDHWHRLGDTSDDEIAEAVRRLEIDILVDLAGHTAHNRLLVFARRPVPVQVSWFGYMCTTGLTSIDYRLTDAWLDPVGSADRYYTEKLFRLPSAACFQPDADSPPISELPASRNGYPTIACLNQWTKVTEQAKDVWSDILRSDPRIRFRIFARGGDDDHVKRLIVKDFSDRGVTGERIDVTGFRPLPVFLASLCEIDFALDPFPYGGGTTTLHAAWMGVPTIAVDGETEISRSTPGILRALRLPELVAPQIEQYASVALALGSDPRRMAEYRASLRDRFACSGIMDAAALTSSLEAAYRTMWRGYCETAQAW
jgi:predicted O-linked N-acetylglucosamine transferase (SPINDLY family)